MENHASVTRCYRLFFSFKCFQISAAVAIAPFEIYELSLNKIFFKSELFSCLPKVDHVIKSTLSSLLNPLQGSFHKNLFGGN